MTETKLCANDSQQKPILDATAKCATGANVKPQAINRGAEAEVDRSHAKSAFETKLESEIGRSLQLQLSDKTETGRSLQREFSKYFGRPVSINASLAG